MPYIRQNRRGQVDFAVEALKKCQVNANGDLNYVLHAYFKRCFPKNYTSIKNYCAELRACAVEIERKLLGPYEDSKEEQNGRIQ